MSKAQSKVDAAEAKPVEQAEAPVQLAPVKVAKEPKRVYTTRSGAKCEDY